MTNAKVEGPRPRGAAWGVLIVLAVILAMAAGFIAMVAATHGPARSEPSGTIAVAEVEGRSVAVVVSPSSHIRCALRRPRSENATASGWPSKAETRARFEPQNGAVVGIRSATSSKVTYVATPGGRSTWILPVGLVHSRTPPPSCRTFHGV